MPQFQRAQSLGAVQALGVGVQGFGFRGLWVKVWSLGSGDLGRFAHAACFGVRGVGFRAQCLLPIPLLNWGQVSESELTSATSIKKGLSKP